MAEIKETKLETVLPREAALEVCPICGSKVIARNGHTLCNSPTCKDRIIEGCCGD